MWTAVTDWAPFFVWLPVLTTRGHFLWLRRGERRQLAYLYRDGFDHLRDVRTISQYRTDQAEWEAA